MFIVGIIDHDGPGETVAEIKSEKDAREFAKNESPNHQWGVYIRNKSGKYDVGQNDYWSCSRAWGWLFD